MCKSWRKVSFFCFFKATDILGMLEFLRKISMNSVFVIHDPQHSGWFITFYETNTEKKHSQLSTQTVKVRDSCMTLFGIRKRNEKIRKIP